MNVVAVAQAAELARDAAKDAATKACLHPVLYALTFNVAGMLFPCLPCSASHTLALLGSAAMAHPEAD